MRTTSQLFHPRLAVLVVTLIILTTAAVASPLGIGTSAAHGTTFARAEPNTTPAAGGLTPGMNNAVFLPAALNQVSFSAGPTSQPTPGAIGVLS